MAYFSEICEKRFTPEELKIIKRYEDLVQEWEKSILGRQVECYVCGDGFMCQGWFDNTADVRCWKKSCRKTVDNKEKSTNTKPRPTPKISKKITKDIEGTVLVGCSVCKRKFRKLATTEDPYVCWACSAECQDDEYQ